MTSAKRALRLREKQGHPQAFADSAKYDCLYKNPFHSRLAPHKTSLFSLYFPLCVWRGVGGRGGYRGKCVCCQNSLFLSFSIFLFSNGRKGKGVKARGAEYHQLLQKLGRVKGVKNLVEECPGNALLLRMDVSPCCRLYQDSLGHCTYNYANAMLWARAG